MTNSDVMEKSIGTEIRWKGENFLTDGQTPEEQKAKEFGSFFKFFTGINMPNASELEDMDENKEQDLVESVEQDFDIASEFKDEIIPNAIFYYFDVKSELEIEEMISK